MNTRNTLALMLALALTLMGASLMIARQIGTAPLRPQGPCDVYGVAGTPCVAAHSTTRALWQTRQDNLRTESTTARGRRPVRHGPAGRPPRP